MLASPLLVIAAVVAPAFSLSKVTRAGRYLYEEDSGDRFYIKGVAYQEQGAQSDSGPFTEATSFIDPLANSTACARDLSFLQQLNVNTIRVYSVNSSLDHDDCMNSLSGAGIYTIIDLTLPNNGSIDRSSPSWTTNLLDQYLTTIDTFSKYDNVLSYNIGNEVITAANETSTAPFLKAAARDVKAYLKSKGQDNILVGMAAIDADRDWLDPLAEFMSCASEDESLDIFGLNNYEWCGDSTFEAAYSDVENNFANYNIPAYFSEFGCITSPPRLWTEVEAIYSSNMSNVWSGAVAFSYFPAESDQGEFGMVTISGDTVTTSDDFTRLASQFGNASGPNTPSESSAGSTNYPTCPQQNSTFIASTTLPPTPNDSACACVVNTLPCQFTPQTDNTSSIVGELIDEACGLLGQAGGNCNDISASGSAGTYGRMAFCDPSSKLSFVMTSYYEATDANAASCDFSGNATINKQAPSNTDQLNSAVSSCLANTDTTFTPSSPSSQGSSGSSSSSSSSSSSGASLGRASFLTGLKSGVIGSAGMLLCMVGTGFWVLA